MILDTQFLGGLVEQKPAARAKARELEDRGVPIRVPAGVVWELYYGVENAAEEQRETFRRGYERLLQVYPVVEIDRGLARRAGELRGKHTRSNSLKNLDGADSMVAATGLSYDEAVVSNDGDFLDVDGLRVETY